MPQVSTEGDACGELETILAEKLRLTTGGKIRAHKELPPVSKEAFPFDIPAAWTWCRLGAIAQEITTGSRGWSQFYSESGPKFIRAQNIRFGRLELDNIAHIDLPVRAEVIADDLDQKLAEALQNSTRLLDATLLQAIGSLEIQADLAAAGA